MVLDNASGSAATVEIARILTEMHKKNHLNALLSLPTLRLKKRVYWLRTIRYWRDCTNQANGRAA